MFDLAISIPSTGLGCLGRTSEIVIFIPSKSLSHRLALGVKCPGRISEIVLLTTQQLPNNKGCRVIFYCKVLDLLEKLIATLKVLLQTGRSRCWITLKCAESSFVIFHRSPLDNGEKGREE